MSNSDSHITIYFPKSPGMKKIWKEVVEFGEEQFPDTPEERRRSPAVRKLVRMGLQLWKMQKLKMAELEAENIGEAE